MKRPEFSDSPHHSADASAERRVSVGELTRLPARLPPVLYFSVAHLSLALAAIGLVAAPVTFAGFFYHPRMLALVHLVTLGWISLSILGSLYIVGPLALRCDMPARQADYWVFAVTTVGVAGVACHFWINEYGGMAWSGVMVLAGFVWLGVRVMSRLRAAPVHGAVKLHVLLAFVNVALAAAAGIVLGFNKIHDFLPGYVLSNVYAHAHLAGIGWVTMLVMGIGYRLIPMVLPSAIPEGPELFLSAVLVELGLLALAAALVTQSAWIGVAVGLVIAGLAAFGRQVVWMLRNARPGPHGLKRPDFGVWHVKGALVFLGIAAIAGATVALSPASEWAMRSAAAYGVFALLGFLAQMIVGMEARILPMFAWYWAFAETGFKGPVISPHEMPLRRLQTATFLAWAAGVPALAAGLALTSPVLVRAAGVLLLVGTVAAAMNLRAVTRHAFARGQRPTER